MNWGLELLSVAAGFLTVLSPCILPILPALLGASVASPLRHRPFWIVLGLALSFTLFGTMFALFGSFLGLSNELLRRIALLILFFLGLSLIWPRLWERLGSRLGDLGQRLAGPSAGTGRTGALLVGASLGLVWAPCAGPVLGIVITLAAVQKSLGQTLLLMGGYALGAAAPMLLIGYGGQKAFGSFRRLRAWGPAAHRALGVLTIASVVAFSLNLETLLLARLPDRLFAASQLEKRLSAQETRRTPPGAQVTTLALAQRETDLPVVGAMPEFVGVTAWLNSPPLSVERLRGKVVLIDFWTYSCINCIRTLPYVTSWYEKYKDRGFVVVGVHTPEFAFEKDEGNVRRAMQRFGVHYPVALDNDYGTWNAYDNHYWPAHYLVDAQGRIREVHFGEGHYEETERAIQNLLAEANRLQAPMPIEGRKADVDFSRIRSPETYIGYARAENFAARERLRADAAAQYSAPAALRLNQWTLTGRWRVESEAARLEGANGAIQFRFQAPALNLVMSGRGARGHVWLDGRPITAENRGSDVAADGSVTIEESRLYNLVRLPPGDDGPHLFVLTFERPGATLYAFTFG
jgi:cytochrome c biogenesis protein CcdA/thiol-disulfide isomerase/thioredoxin